MLLSVYAKRLSISHIRDFIYKISKNINSFKIFTVFGGLIIQILKAQCIQTPLPPSHLVTHITF